MDPSAEAAAASRAPDGADAAPVGTALNMTKPTVMTTKDRMYRVENWGREQEVSSEPRLLPARKPTLYWKRKIPQKRLNRSAVSSDRFTAVALVVFTTLGMQLYSATMLKT